MKATVDRFESDMAMLLTRGCERKAQYPHRSPSRGHQGKRYQISITIDQKETDNSTLWISRLIDRLKRESRRISLVQDQEE